MTPPTDQTFRQAYAKARLSCDTARSQALREPLLEIIGALNGTQLPLQRSCCISAGIERRAESILRHAVECSPEGNGAWVIVVEEGCDLGGRAPRVHVPMDQPLREDSAVEVCEVVDEHPAAILLHNASSDIA